MLFIPPSHFIIGGSIDVTAYFIYNKNNCDFLKNQNIFQFIFRIKFVVFLFSLIYTIKKELIIIDIQIKKHNRIQTFFIRFFNRLEDLIFTIFQKTPEPLIPSFLMNWMDKYTKKRLHELEQAVIRQKWRKAQLEKAVAEIHDRQQNTKEAP